MLEEEKYHRRRQLLSLQATLKILQCVVGREFKIRGMTD